MASMTGEKVSDDGRDIIEVNLVFQRDIYDTIDRVSRKLGMEPSTWIDFVLTSKLKGMEQDAGDR